MVFEATGAEVDNFDAGLVNLTKQDVFRFEIAMHDVMLSHVVKGNEDLDRETLD